MSSYRTRKDLANVNFRNLNGSLNFEALMVFAQLQILILACTFIFGFSKIVNLIIEIKDLQMLGHNAEEWELIFGSRSPGSVQILVGLTVSMQIVLLCVAIRYMMIFIKSGLSWSNQQVALRSRDFFLVVATVVLPLVAIYFYMDYSQSFMTLSSLPEIQNMLISSGHLWTAKILFYGFLATSFYAFLAVVFKNHAMLDKYIFVQAVLTAVLIGFGFYVFIRYFIFDWASIFGFNSYFTLHWTELIKQVNLNEFKGGLLSCLNGKYDSQAKLTVDFNELQCTVPQDLLKSTTPGNLASELWEIKIDDQAEYTCLNPHCRSALRLFL